MLNEKYFYLTLLGDFIISKISNDENFQLTLVDFNNFIVLKGKTTSTSILNLSDIVSDFKKIYSKNLPKDLNLNTIDLIEYDQPIFYSKRSSIKIVN
jgi:hypothetical protein